VTVESNLFQREVYIRNSNFIIPNLKEVYKDIITYELAEGINKDHLIEVAQDIIDNWMKNLPGFISWEIHNNDEGKYTDIVSWASKVDAKNAELEMMKIPNAGEWFACYKEDSISSIAVKSVKKF